MIKRYQEDPSMEELYEQRNELDKMMEQHPSRFMEYQGRDGEMYIQDCRSPPFLIDKVMIKNGASKEDIEEAKRIKKFVFENDLSAKKRKITNQINKALKSRDGNQNSDKYILDKYDSYILELFGQFYTADQIWHKLKEKKGVTINKPALYLWKKTHEEKIQVKQTEMVLSNRHTEIKVSNETSRLLTYNELLDFWNEKLDPKLSDAANERVTKMMVLILDQARKETKGDIITVNGRIDINATIQGEKQVDQIFSRLSVNSMVIGLVAAEQNIDPSFLISALSRSFYREQNGFNGEVNDALPERHAGDLIKQFNWDNVEHLVASNNEEPKKLDTRMEMIDSSIDMETRRDEILQKLIQFKKNNIQSD